MNASLLLKSIGVLGVIFCFILLALAVNGNISTKSAPAYMVMIIGIEICLAIVDIFLLPKINSDDHR